jgi:hypothetical protein
LGGGTATTAQKGGATDGVTGGNTAANGSANTGGGAGGGSGGGGDGIGGTGGSGIVIISYSDTFAAATSTTGSPNISTSGGNRIYKWTGSGSITF